MRGVDQRRDLKLNPASFAVCVVSATCVAPCPVQPAWNRHDVVFLDATTHRSFVSCHAQRLERWLRHVQSALGMEAIDDADDAIALPEP